MLVTLSRASVVLTCAGVLEAQADETDTRKLSVVAVSPAIVVRSVSRGCLAARSVTRLVTSAWVIANAAFTCVGVLDAQAEPTDWMMLSVVAVNPAMVVRSASSGCSDDQPTA